MKCRPVQQYIKKLGIVTTYKPIRINVAIAKRNKGIGID